MVVYRTKKSPHHLTGICSSLSQKVLSILSDLDKKFSTELLVEYGTVQGMLGELSVLAIPMHTGSWHCVNYEIYPKEPRFLTAAKEEGAEAKLGLLGTKPFSSLKDQSIVFLVEGLWDMLSMVQHGFPTLGLPGVNNFHESWLTFFQGKVVYLLFDNDPPGRQFSTIHFNKIRKVARSVKILKLPVEVSLGGASHRIKDISDCFNISVEVTKELISKLISEEAPDRESIQELIFSMLIAKGHAMQKAKNIANIIINDIESRGGSIIPYNSMQELAFSVEGKYIVAEEKINIFLSREYGYCSSQTIWNQIKDELYNYAVKNDEFEVYIYSIHRNGKIYIGTKNNGLLIIEPERIYWGDQGTDGIFVKSDNVIDFDFLNRQDDLKSQSPPIKTFDDILDLFIYEGSPYTQKFLIKSWFYYTFFNPVMKSILCVIGVPGSGKSFLQKMIKGLLYGFSRGISNPSSIPEEDYVFTMMLKDSKYLFLDEVNQGDPKIKSKFRMLVTGEEINIRPKYERKSIKFRPSVWLIVSSHAPKFREADISQRMLIIRLDELREKERIQESVYFDLLEPHRSSIWKSIVLELQRILQNLQRAGTENIPLKNYCRQVEMSNFAWKAFPDKKDLCLKTFESLYSQQMDFSTEMDPIMDLFIEWHEEKSPSYKNGSGRIEVEARQLYKDLLPMAKDRRIGGFPLSVTGFSKWVNNRKENLKDFEFERVWAPKEKVFLYRFKAPEREKF